MCVSKCFWLMLLFHLKIFHLPSSSIVVVVLKRHCEIFRLLAEPLPSSLLTAGRQLAGGHVDPLNCTYHQCGNTEECYCPTHINTHNNQTTQNYTHINTNFQSPQ